MVELFLLRKSSDVDGLEARQRLPSVFEIVGNRLIREIAEPIVVTIVANLRGKFRLGAQRVLLLLGEQASEFGAAGFEGLPSGVGEEWDSQSHSKRENHERCSQEAGLGTIVRNNHCGRDGFYRRPPRDRSVVPCPRPRILHCKRSSWDRDKCPYSESPTL